MKWALTSAVLSLSLLSASSIEAASSQPDFGFPGRLPTVDIYGLPINEPVTGTITMPLLTQEQILTPPGHEGDIVDIIQLQSLYEFYHDGHNGPGVASLFAANGIFELPLNDGQGHLSPTGGTTGNGCAAFGFAQIADFFNAAGGVPPLPFTAKSHHVMTSAVVTISRDGNFATLNANYVDDSVNSSNMTVLGHEGEYINDFVLTAQGWKFIHLRALEDFPTMTANCTLAGQGPK